MRLASLLRGVATRDARAHGATQLGVGLAPGRLCTEGHTACIDSTDLRAIVRARREFANRGDFHRIYPSPVGILSAHAAC